MSKKDYPKFIFLSGLPRSGGISMVRSFDNHPEVLVWPVEFFYFEFFQKIATSQKKASLHKLNEALEQVFVKQFTKEIRKEKFCAKYFRDLHSTSNKKIKEGEFDYQIFSRNLYLKKDQEINSIDYLMHIFECMKNANSVYVKNSIKYYLIYTTSRGFDWNDENLIRKSFFIFSCREIESSCSSLKEKNFIKKGLDLKTYFSIKTKKSFLYWVESYRLISERVEPYINRENFFIVRLNDLQKAPEDVIKKICTILQIEPHPNLFKLTFFGTKYSGNANQSNLNSGKIAYTTSHISVPLCSFEKRIFKSLRLYDYEKNKKSNYVPFHFIEMIKIAFKSSFFELPAKNIWYVKKFRYISNIVGRSIIFVNFCTIYFILKSDRVSMTVIRRWNKHLSYMPLWNNAVRYK